MRKEKIRMSLTRKFNWLATASVFTAIAVSEAEGQVHSRLKPIGAPSAVDAFTSTASSKGSQISRMQAIGDNRLMAPPSLPPGGFGLPTTPIPQSAGPMPPGSPPNVFTLPPSGALPMPLQSTPAGPIAPPRTAAPPTFQSNPVMSSPQATPVPSQSLPINPNLGVGSSVSPGTTFSAGPSFPATQRNPSFGGSLPRQPSSTVSSDYVAIPPPQLNNAFATMGNCRNISGSSTYRASGAFGCGTPASYAPVAYIPPPSQIAPVVALPPGATFNPVIITGSVPPVIPGSAGYRPLISLGQEFKPVQVGQGIIGQPVAYVPGQFFRNALRYISF